MQSANVAVGHVGGPGATPGISLRVYNGEEDLPDVIRLIETELRCVNSDALRLANTTSEPYNIYTYRYFLHQWYVQRRCCGVRLTLFRPQLSYLVRERMQLPEIDRMQACAGAPAADEPRTVGVIIGKLERHMRGSRLWRGYIAMLSVDPGWRGHGIGAHMQTSSLGSFFRGTARGKTNQRTDAAWCGRNRARDRSRQCGGHPSVRADGLYPREATLPLLSQQYVNAARCRVAHMQTRTHSASCCRYPKEHRALGGLPSRRGAI